MRISIRNYCSQPIHGPLAAPVEDIGVVFPPDVRPRAQALVFGVRKDRLSRDVRGVNVGVFLFKCFHLEFGVFRCWMVGGLNHEGSKTRRGKESRTGARRSQTGTCRHGVHPGVAFALVADVRDSGRPAPRGIRDCIF